MRHPSLSSHQSHLTPQQYQILELVGRYRFVSAPLLAQYYHLSSRSVTNDRLSRLVRHGFLQRRYDSSYRLRGKAAAYTLGTPGIAALRSRGGVAASLLRLQYKNNQASDSFVDHCLAVFATAITFRQLYPNGDLLTAADLAGHDDFPPPRPDLLLSYPTDSAPPRQHLVLYLADQPRFIARHRCRRFLTALDDSDWADTTSSASLILLVSPASLPPLRRDVATLLEDLGLDDELTVLTTTPEQLAASRALRRALR